MHCDQRTQLEAEVGEFITLSFCTPDFCDCEAYAAFMAGATTSISLNLNHLPIAGTWLVEREHWAEVWYQLVKVQAPRRKGLPRRSSCAGENKAGPLQKAMRALHFGS